MLIGNVGNDPEIRYLDSNPQGPQGNAKVASFRLATTERYRDRNGETRENTEWHNIVAWRSNADLIERFVHKGSQIFVEGKLRTRQWTDQTGNKRYTTEIQVDNLQLLGKRPDAPQQPGYDGPSQPAPAYRPQGAGYPQPQSQGYQGPGYQQGSYQGQAGGFQGAQPQSYPPQPAQAPAQPAPSAYPAPSDSPEDDLPF
jgi:single-strand DNA-binding protein